jgi:cullin-associated NEDD8-dissociated protein 1
MKDLVWCIMYIYLPFTGLKTVISELPPSSTALAASICKKITGRLTSAISKVGNCTETISQDDQPGDADKYFKGT